MDLKTLLGDELFTQVDAKIQEHNGSAENKDNPVKFVDLSEGGYVGKEKYTSLQTEAGGYKTQLGEANEAIKSYKGLDVEGIKKAAADWETKHKTDTENLQKTLETERKTHAAERYLDTQRIKSPLSRKAIMQEFMAQNLELKDGVFVGAEDYMKKVKEQYPDEFAKEEREPEGPKKFVRTAVSGTGKPRTVSGEQAYRDNKYKGNKYYGM